MFHATLFALLGGMFLLFAFSAGRADQFVVAIPAVLLALWMADASIRSARGVLRKRRATRNTNSTDDGRE